MTIRVAIGAGILVLISGTAFAQPPSRAKVVAHLPKVNGAECTSFETARQRAEYDLLAGQQRDHLAAKCAHHPYSPIKLVNLVYACQCFERALDSCALSETACQ